MRGGASLQRSARRALSAGLGLVFFSACGAATPSAAPAAPAPAAPSNTASGERCSGAPRPDAAALELHVRPLPEDAGGAIAIREVLTAPAGAWPALLPPAGLRQALEVQVSLHEPGCDPTTGQPRPTQQTLRAEPGVPLDIGARVASPEGARLQLEYRLESLGNRLLDANRFLAEGRQLFFLPASPGAERAQTRVVIDTSAYGHDGRAVSSLGLGAERRAPMTPQAVGDALFAAGYLGSAQFDAPEGHDDAAWFGSPLFDPRPLAAEIASFRSAVRERLRDTSDNPLTTILIVDAGLSDFEVRRAPASVLLRITPGQMLTAELRLAILHQVLKEWIGGRLTLFDESGAEAVWFSEGVCRYLARELAFEFGLIAPLEYLDQINALLAIQQVLGGAAHAAACAAEAGVPGGPFSGCRDLLALARGALLAGELDRALVARGTSLSALLGGWLREQHAPLTPGEWASAVQGQAGEPAAALLASFARGAPILPPSGAFGPCFARVASRLARSELGFEYTIEPAASGPGRWRVTRVSEHGPAFAAGLRADVRLGAIDFAPYAADRPVRLLAADGQLLEYRARARAVPAVVWKRLPGVPDPRCLQP